MQVQSQHSQKFAFLTYNIVNHTVDWFHEIFVGVNLCFFFAAFDRNDLDKIVTADLPAFSGYNVFLSDLITLRLDFLSLSFQSKIIIN